MANIKILGDVELAGSLAFNKNYTDFPAVGKPREILVKGGIPYIYTELVDGSGFFTWQPIGVKQASYLHTQGLASTVWTVNHNFNSNDFAYFVYDSNHNLVIANIDTKDPETGLEDLNKCRILLTSAITGSVVLFSLQFLNSTTLSASQELLLNGTTVTSNAGVLTVDGSPVAFKGYVDSQDAVLSARIDNIVSNVNPGAIDSISELLTAFQSADGDLSTAISTLSTSSSLAIAAEETRALSVETALQGSIDTVSSSVESLSATTQSELNLKTNDADLAVVAKSGSYNDLSNKPTIPSSVSALTNDSGYVTSVDITAAIVNKADKSTTLSGYGIVDAYTTTQVDSSLASKAPLANPTFTGTVSGITKSMVGLGNVDNTSDLSKPVSTATQTALDLKANVSSLATVATTGSYTDLSNKPSIPSKVSDLTNDSNFQTGSQVTSAIQAVVDAAPAALDTLKEIADQLASDESAVSALTAVVATKASMTYVDGVIASTLSSTATDLATETSERISADSALQGSIDDEVSARISADSLLQSNINLKADQATTASGYGITDVYTKAEVDAAIAAAIEAFAATLYV